MFLSCLKTFSSLVYKNWCWTHFGLLLFSLAHGQASSSSNMFKLWVFWAFLRIQLLGFLRNMTTFMSGQASRPDLASLALLPGQLQNCLRIYPGSDDSGPAPRAWLFPPLQHPVRLLCARCHRAAGLAPAPSHMEKLGLLSWVLLCWSKR